MYKFRVFHSDSEPETCLKYMEGHVKVLTDYGITNVTSNNTEWIKWGNSFCVIAENENGIMVGGIRVQKADGINNLPVEKAIGHLDPNIYSIVNSYIDDGVGELCALWNAKEVAGIGLSLLLVRAAISAVNQVGIKTLMGICADYTMEMFRRVGFVVDNSLGENGEFIYPNKNYIARVLGILNAKDLSTADEYDRLRMLAIRQQPVQRYLELGSKGNTIQIDYSMTLEIKKSLIDAPL